MHIAGLLASLGFPPMDANLHDTVEVRTTHLEDMALEDELAESHYSRLHWVRATTATPIRIRDV